MGGCLFNVLGNIVNEFYMHEYNFIYMVMLRQPKKIHWKY